MRKILLVPNILRPSNMLRRMWKHNGDISSSSKGKILAKRIILGKRVIFYENGFRYVLDRDLNETDNFNSQILKFAHASILINEPVGDKSQCWVDASTNPVTVIIYGFTAEEFIRRTTLLIRQGQLDKDFVLNSTIRASREYTNERNVQLFGR